MMKSCAMSGSHREKGWQEKNLRKHQSMGGK